MNRNVHHYHHRAAPAAQTWLGKLWGATKLGVTGLKTATWLGNKAIKAVDYVASHAWQRPRYQTKQQFKRTLAAVERAAIKSSAFSRASSRSSRVSRGRKSSKPSRKKSKKMYRSKKRSYKKKSYKKKSYKRKRSSQARRGGFISYRGAINGSGEQKFVDDHINNQLLSGTRAEMIHPQQFATSSTPMTVIGQGNTNSTRIGRFYTIQQIYMNGFVTYTAAGAQNPVYNQPTIVTLYLILDKQCRGTAPSGSDIFSDPGGTSDFTPNLMRNLDNTERFSVLWQKKLTIPMMTTYTGTANTTNITRNRRDFKLVYNCRIPVKMKSATADGTLANTEDNIVYLAAISSQSGSIAVPKTTNEVRLSANVRVRFSDGR